MIAVKSAAVPKNVIGDDARPVEPECEINPPWRASVAVNSDWPRPMPGRSQSSQCPDRQTWCHTGWRRRAAPPLPEMFAGEASSMTPVRSANWERCTRRVAGDCRDARCRRTTK